MNGIKTGTQLIVQTILIIIVSSTTLRSESDKSVGPKYVFTHINVPLQNNRVECIFEDSFGYLWIGTLGGLHKFDGVDITIYHPSPDSTTIDVDRIEVIHEDSKNRLWICTEEGIYQYVRSWDQFKKIKMEDHFLDSTNHRPKRTEVLLEDESGRIWIGNERVGLQYFDEERGEFVAFFQEGDNDQLRLGGVLGLAGPRDGKIWFSSEGKGLFEVDLASKIATQYIGNPEENAYLSNARIYKLLLDNQDRLWIGTDGQGLARLDLNEATRKLDIYRSDRESPNALFNNAISYIYQDNQNNIWICNENGGLHLYMEADDSFFRYLPENGKYSVSNISIKVVSQDRYGRIWVGTHLAGIDVYDPYLHQVEHFNSTGDEGALTNNVIRNFLEDSENNIWIATDGGGLNYFDRSRNWFEAFRSDSKDNTSINSDAVLGLEIDTNGRMWVGTWRGGINILNKTEKTFSRPYQHVTSATRIFNILRTKDNHMWVADQAGGVNLFGPNGEFLDHYVNDPEGDRNFGTNNAVVLMEAEDGNIWVGTGDNGIVVIHRQEGGISHFQHHAHNASDPRTIPNVRINHLYQDSRSIIWAASSGGLSRYYPESNDFYTYNMKNGLPANAVKSIVEDHHGYLWLGTAKGISKFDVGSETFRNYTEDDGFQPGVFTRYAARRLKSGELIFGGYNGFNIFHPDSLMDNPHAPIIQFTGLKLFNELQSVGTRDSPLNAHLDLLKELRLNFDHSVFTITYAGINFTQAHRITYAYRMVGFETDWNYVGSKREATYTNLDPGEYRFEVKASNNDGVWTHEPTSLKIIIIPPWWKTLYFRVAMILFGALIVIGIIRYRTYALLKEQAQLEQIVKLRTDEIKQLNQNLAISEKMASLGVFTSGIAHEINNPLNFISGAAQKVFDILEKQQINGKNTGFENEEMLTNLREIMQVGIKRATQIVGSLRNFSREDTGIFVKSDIDGCLEDALMILRYKIKKQGISVFKSLKEHPEIECLPGRITQVFVNLINNAIEAVGQNGEIYIEIFSEGENLVATFRDNGPGIDEGVKARLFDPFFSTKGEGTGLGLYIVYGIVKEHGGRIDVESGKQGTTFYVRLPVHQAQLA